MTYRESIILNINYLRIVLMNTGMKNAYCILLILTSKYMIISISPLSIKLSKKKPLNLRGFFNVEPNLASICFTSVSQIIMLFFSSFFVLDVLLTSINQCHLLSPISPRSPFHGLGRFAACIKQVERFQQQLLLNNLIMKVVLFSRFFL